MYRISKKKMNSLFAKAQWSRRKKVIALQKKGIENADKLLPRFTKREFTETYLRIRQMNKETGYKLNVLKETEKATLQKRTYKQWKAFKKSMIIDEMEKGSDRENLENLSSLEFMYADTPKTKSFDRFLSNKNEELKANGIENSYDRRRIIAQEIFGSD